MRLRVPHTPTSYNVVGRVMKPLLSVSLFVIVLFLCTVEREALLDIPNVYNYQTFVETDKAGYLIRQWVASNLYDRIRCVSFPPSLVPTISMRG